jgi:hypothetical protein
LNRPSAPRCRSEGQSIAVPGGIIGSRLDERFALLAYTTEKNFRTLLWVAFLLAAVLGHAVRTAADDPCPTDIYEIATDRPDVTNSSLAVPFGSLQAENGIDWSVRHGSNAVDGTNTRLRLGVAHCTEFLIDVPGYFDSFSGSQQPSGFSDIVASVKRQLPVPFGFDLSATAGLGFPSGSSNISGLGYQPYIQFPWSHEIDQRWGMAGMLTLTWFPGEAARNPTFEPHS